MQRLAGRLSPGVLTEETLIAVITFDLRLLSKLPNIDCGDTLEESHPFEDRFNRTGGIQLVEETLDGWHDLHQALHNLLWHLQYESGGLCASSSIALLARKH